MDKDQAHMWDRIIREDEEQGLPFIDMPSATDIAHYFTDDCLSRFDGQGADGINLWREGRDYCYVWMEAHVDHDLEQYFLLDIRTNMGDNETRDYLYVCVGMGDRVECEWHNHPVPFRASFGKHMDRFVKAMHWFTDRIVSEREKLASHAGESPYSEDDD